MLKKIFIFCHGWSFDKSFWDPLNKYFYNQECIYLDLGYFNQNNLQDLIKTMPKYYTKNYYVVAVTHSFGLIRLLSLGFKFNLIIAIQSFINFLGTTHQLRLNRTKELSLMIENFTKNPNQTLLKFYRACNKRFIINQNINYNLLLSDLKALYLNYDNTLPNNIPILIINASNDPIVPTELIEDNFKNNKQAIIKTINSKTHNLCNNHSNFLFELTKDFINYNYAN